MTGSSPTVLLAVPDDARRARLRTWVEQMKHVRADLADAATPEAARDALSEGGADVCLLDATLDGDGGHTLLAVAAAGAGDAALVVLADDAPPRRVVGLLREGAADVLAWETLGVTRLETAVQYALARRQAATARRLGGDTLQPLLENAQDIITVAAADGTMRFVSPSAERVLGHPPAFYIGKNAFAFIHEDDHDAVFQALVEVLADLGAVRQVTYRFRHRDGSWRVLESLGSAVTDDDGVRVVVNSRDVTERVQAEAALRSSEARNRALLDAIPDALARIGPDGTYRGYKAAPGFAWFVDLDAFVGKTPGQVLPPDVARRMEQARQQALETGRMQTIEYDIEIDGAVRVREARLVAYGEDEVIVILRDFTEQRRAQERLRESEAKFRDLFENSPDAIFVESLDAVVLDVNLAACRLHDRPREELVGRSVLDLVPPEERERVLHFFNKMAAGDVEFLEGFSWTAAGQSVPVEIRARRIVYGHTPALLLHVRDVTERRRAEASLRRSEARNRAIVDALPDALVRLDRDGTYLEIRVPGDYDPFDDPQRLVGTSAYEMLPPEVARRARACVDRALETGTMQSFEYEIEVRGEVRVREGRVVPCGEDEVISIQRDFTERRRAEQEARRLKAFYEQVLDDLPADVAVMDPEGRILYLNTSSVQDPEMRRWLIGKTGVDYCRRRGLDLALAERRQQFIREAATERRIVRFEETLPGREGEKRHVLRIASPVLDDDGRVVQVIGYGLDITERKLAEEALRQSEALLRTVVTNVPVMLFAFDAQGTFTLAEGKGLHAFGLSSDDLVGRSAFAFDDAYPGVQDDLRRALDGASFSASLEIHGYAFEYWYAPLTHDDGRVVGALAVAADVTEMKRSQNELERSREQLRELAQHLQTIREDERTRISREVHDQLGQALTALRMDVSWIEKGLRADQQKLQERIDDMKGLIKDTIHTVRRIASELRPGILDDLGLVAALEWQTQEFGNRTGVRCLFTDGAGFAELDRNRATAIFRVFQEILTNVARHAEASRVDVSLHTDAGELVLTVADNGRGIEDLDTVHSNSLGMLGMRERTQAWGGRVTFDSAPGQGTTVTVRVPLPEMETV